MPTDLGKAIKGTAKVEAAWHDLTPLARRDFITWVDSAKQAETRARRIEKAASMLLAGKRRPCCYAIVPMNLYKALGEMPKAKAQWGELTPIERRDFVDWVDSIKEKDERALRIVRVCGMLAAGKRRP